MYNSIRNWFDRNYKTIIRFSYVVPILFVAVVSIGHVITWYNITNPISWAVYLSIGVEIAALSSLAGMAVKRTSAVYLPFILVTLIQFIGNIFFCFQFIKVNSPLFLEWVKLVDPLFSLANMVTPGDLDSHRRWLALFGGALLPLISLSFLHLLVKFNDREAEKDDKITETNVIEEIKPEEKPVITEDDGGYHKIFKVPVGGVTEEQAKEVVKNYIETIKEPVIIEESVDSITPEVMSPEEEIIADEQVNITDEVINEASEEIHENISHTKPVTNTIQRIGSNKFTNDNGKRIFYKKRGES